jgi:PAS domain S-box-containing protein
MPVLGPRPRDLGIPTERDLRRRLRRQLAPVLGAFALLGLLVFDLLPIETSRDLDIIFSAIILVINVAVFGYLLLEAGRERIGTIRTLSVLFEGLPAGILFLDEGARVTYANPALEQLTGYALSEATGSSVATFVHHEDRARVAIELANRKAGAISTYEMRIVRKDGKTLLAAVNAIPFFDGDRYDGSLAVVSDLTDILEAQARAARYKELSSFALDAVTHDLSNRMQEVVARTGITGALMAKDAGPAKASMAKLAQSADRAAALIKEVKQIADAERGNWPKRSIEVAALVDRALTLAAIAAGLGLEAEVSPEAAVAKVAANDLAPFVLSKLLEEAAEASSGQKGGGGVLLEATVEAGPAAQALLRVHGYARSVSEEDLKLLLAPAGTRAELNTPWRSGVKLSFAAAVAQAQGWAIGATREKEGEGVVFEVRIPLERAWESGTLPNPATPPAPPAQTPAAGATAG